MRAETYVGQTRHRNPLQRLNCILSEAKRLVLRVSGGWFCDPWQRRPCLPRERLLKHRLVLRSLLMPIGCHTVVLKLTTDRTRFLNIRVTIFRSYELLYWSAYHLGLACHPNSNPLIQNSFQIKTKTNIPKSDRLAVLLFFSYFNNFI
jgi:hypothetical protein